MYKLLLLFICFLRIAYSTASAQSFDSIAISFNSKKTSDSIINHVFAENGRYKIPEIHLARYPKVYNAVLIDPADLIGDDAVLHISALDYAVHHSPYYAIKKIKYVEPSRIIDSVDTIEIPVTQYLGHYVSETVMDGIYVRESPDSIQLNYRTSTGLENRLSESYVKYNSFLEDQDSLIQSLESDFQQYRSLQLQPAVNDWLQPFYMTQAEVSNYQYRQFVNWVRDSLAYCILYDSLPPLEAVKLLNCTKKQRALMDPELKIENRARYGLNFHALDRKNGSFYDQEPYLYYLVTMYYPQAERFYKSRDINVSQLIYQSSATSPTPVYPDTNGWMKEGDEAFYSMYTGMYFWHPGFDNYPVVGVNEAQMKAYCDWYQRQENAKLIDAPYTVRVELPNIYHYELAVKQCSSAARRNTIDTQPAAPFIIHRSDEEAEVFVRSVYPRMVDEPDLNNELYRKLHAWLIANQSYPIWNLAGNVSEYCAPLQPEFVDDSTQMTVLGGNRLIGLVDPNENQFNTVFYQQHLPANTGSSTVGFRMILFLDWKK